MYVAPGVTAADLPGPPSVDEIARRFAVPLLTFAEQDALEEAGAATVAHGDVLTEVTLTYTFWRNPSDRSDPVNLAELTPEARAGLDAEPVGLLPAWLLEARERMRFPSLWEAVRTTAVPPAERRATHQRPEAVLVQHADYILMNLFRAERVRGGFPGELLGRATEQAIQHDASVIVGAAEVPALRFDTDAHVLGLAADLGDRVLSVVIDREFLPSVRLAFAERRAPAAV